MIKNDTIALEARDARVHYGRIAAVHGIKLTVRKGELVTIIGPNGAGKSSLLNMLAGVLPAGASGSGAVHLFGEDISIMPPERRVSQGLSLVPESRALFSSMTVEDNIVLGAWTRWVRRDPAHLDQMERVFGWFPRLRERREQLAGTLSGGERQMLALARALMARPRVLLLDEPSLGLAPRVVAEIFDIIEQLRQSGLSILLVEQNARAALQAADYGCVLELGEVILEGDAEDLIEDQRLESSYLGASAAT